MKKTNMMEKTNISSWLVAVSCLCGLFVAGCGSGNFVTLPDPMKGLHVSNQAANNTTSSPTASVSKAPAHLSNKVGMGDTVTWIEQRWGKPSRFAMAVNAKGEGDVFYRHNQIYVRYSNHRAFEIDDTFTKPVSLSAAKAIAHGFIPSDSKQTTTLNNTTAKTVVTFYHSTSIKRLWPPGLSYGIVGTLSVKIFLSSTGKDVKEILVQPGEES